MSLSRYCELCLDTSVISFPMLLADQRPDSLCAEPLLLFFHIHRCNCGSARVGVAELSVCIFVLGAMSGTALTLRECCVEFPEGEQALLRGKAAFCVSISPPLKT